MRLSLIVVLLAGCGGQSVQESSDPRCVELCTNKNPVSGDTDKTIQCTDESGSECRAKCGAKIYGMTTTCGNCLLENASFTSGFSHSNCSNTGGQTTCTDAINGKSCSYDPQSDAQLKGCLAQWYPDKTIACFTEFHHSLQDCSVFCK